MQNKTAQEDDPEHRSGARIICAGDVEAFLLHVSKDEQTIASVQSAFAYYFPGIMKDEVGHDHDHGLLRAFKELVVVPLRGSDEEEVTGEDGDGSGDGMGGTDDDDDGADEENGGGNGKGATGGGGDGDEEYGLGGGGGDGSGEGGGLGCGGEGGGGDGSGGEG